MLLSCIFTCHVNFLGTDMQVSNKQNFASAQLPQATRSQTGKPE